MLFKKKKSEVNPLFATGSNNNDDWYSLQRKATHFKKTGDMDAAIDCLRRSNALADKTSDTVMQESDYLRLPKYLRKAGRTEEADQEEEKIYQRHPEFKDRRISNKRRIDQELLFAKKYSEDLVKVYTSTICPVCSKYNRKIYSISGENMQYPPMPQELRNGGFCPECVTVIGIYIEGVPPKA